MPLPGDASDVEDDEDLDDDGDDRDDLPPDDEDDDGRIETPPQPPRPPRLADEIRQILGLPATMKLRFREEHGGWSTVDGDFLGRNVPTIRAAVAGLVRVDGRRAVLGDGTSVSARMAAAPDVAVAERAIAQLRRRLSQN